MSVGASPRPHFCFRAPGHPTAHILAIARRARTYSLELPVRVLKWSLALCLLMCWLVSGSAYAVTPPPCLPKVQWPLAVVTGPIPAGVSTREDTYAVWVCNLPAGYKVQAWLFTMPAVSTVALNYALGTWTKANADADCATNCADATATETTFLQQLMAANKPPARVAFNGNNPVRSVYSANADGSLNPTPVAGSSVAVAASCDSGTRIPGTTYYSVQGLPDASKAGLILGALFAVCVVSLPIGAN